MRLVRFFHSVVPTVGEEVLLEPNAARQASKVLRMREGDAVELVCGDGINYVAEIVNNTRQETWVRIDKATPSLATPKAEIRLYLALLKGEAMDWAIQKAVELGVSAIIPLNTARSERRLDAQRWEKRAQHWQGIMIAAALQCGRAEWPQLSEPKGIDADILQPSCEQNWLFSPHDSAEQGSLIKAPSSIAVMIGPEGGFTPAETQIAIQSGWQSKSFGTRILRADTAAVAALVLAQSAVGVMVL
ncbi:16S rRNA (uracil(1498)-N(3))-methyltransferase [Suttonella ornithocola]|uniref:Ribosomal RNA small subunit methyltransferase E n=1 Tax=Suttonella ornithocola TaxID=279832 RepID=A0A380MQZ2_9GAMM|nr:16S rRNA (uracil(1498)-N(3))-methyltransferase [Suttonella ornithocola]SUO94594.1 Ribosomal RNA small subunit methyltransferase E [Suttonella ornithocola]